MNQKLFTVDDSFSVKGRSGTVITGKLGRSSPPFKIGSVVVLVQPDGIETMTEVSGIETIKPRNAGYVKSNKVEVLIKNVTKENIPVGTEVFLKS